MSIRSKSSTVELMGCAAVSASHRVANRWAPVLLCTLAATCAASAAAPAPAATSNGSLPTGGHANELFIPTWDASGDGKVPRTEYDSVRAQRFALADENSDGALSAEEYINEYAVRLDREIADERKASIAQTHVRFRALDRDEAGSISRAEYDASGVSGFVRLDHDKDGRIAKTDPDVARVDSAPGKEPQRTESASRSQQRSVVRMPSTHTRAGFLEIYDGDGDDVVTRAQYEAQRTNAFAATDFNHDGKLDETEYVDEFADRLDRQIARVRQAQLKQGQVRFDSIDKDKNAAIDREEYVAMSARTFERADTNKDGVVSQDDPPPARGRDDERMPEKTADRS